MTKCPYCGSTRPFILEGREILGLRPRRGCLDCDRWLDDGEEDAQDLVRVKAWARRWKRQAKLERRHRRVLRSGLYHRALAAEAAEAWARRWKRKAQLERFLRITRAEAEIKSLAMEATRIGLAITLERLRVAEARALAAEAKLSEAHTTKGP